MNSSLLKDREEFRKRAMAVPVVENKKRKVEEPPAKKSSSVAKPSSNTDNVFAKIKSSMGPTSNYKFGVLTKIVRHMKERHMAGEDHPLNLEEILDETSQLDVSTKTRMWLSNEALKQNPKLEVVEGDKYIYKPPFILKDRKSLLKLLKRKDLNGDGGIYYDDVLESLPKCEKIVKNLTADQKIIQIKRKCDNKIVLYYFDHTTDLPIDEEFCKLWRGVSVDGVDDNKIEEYLEKQGISSMRDNGPKKFLMPKRKKGNTKRKFRAPRDNEHMADVLQDYSEMTASKAEK